MKTKKDVENEIKALSKAFFNESSPIQSAEVKKAEINNYDRSEYFL